MNNLAIIKFVWAFFLIISLVSCIKKGTELSKVYCPPKPTPECRPQSWTSSDIDTAENAYQDYKYNLRKVKNLNSITDEWQLSYNSNDFFLTFSDKNIHKAAIVKKIDIDEFLISKGIDFSDNKHFGSIIGKSKDVLLAISNLPSKDSIIKNISNGIGFSRLYNAQLNGNQISNLEIINFETKLEDWIGQPAIYKNNKIIFFSSDREGGFGANDIWYIYQGNNGRWSSPINCGPNINTPCDELSPFIESKGENLFFASSGHQSVGGYDIFKSNISELFPINFSDTNSINKFFGKSHNLGSPINSKNDELFPFSDTNIDSVLYFSSNRDNDNFDIYVINKENKIKSKPDLVTKKDSLSKTTKSKKDSIIIATPIPQEIVEVKVKLRGKVMGENRIIILDSAKIDIQKIPEFTLDTSLFTDNQGQFEVDLTLNKDYRITAHKDQYFYDSKDITVDSNLINNELTFYLPLRGEIRINFPLDEYNNPYRFTLDSNGIETSRKWQDELDIVAENIKYSLKRIDKVILVGHTDYLDTDEYNIKLGERRVNFVINELVNRGIPKDKLFGRSAGENEPLIKRKNENEDNYRKRLRRVTIEKILLN